ncbi:MAG TPA: CRISPR-associated endonuclease Cas2 [Methylomirabilota bacterium]|jgi:CRISPR-associated protein Cas2|nr:CRISPR-associated endonuclease Cas2 [Methylomirabilota bacterium]
MFYLVTYDISDDRRRSQAAKILEDFGDRVQYSVFEMELERFEQFTEMRCRLEKIVDLKTDSVRIYFLCQGCHTKVTILGQGEVYQDQEVYIVGEDC